MMRQYLNKNYLLLAVLLVFYSVGLVGLCMPQYRDQFFALTPLNLLISGGIVIITTESISQKLGLWMAGVALLGFLTEAVGVNTGYIFGHYTYGDTLGFKTMGTPLVIGINWLILTFGAATLFQYKEWHPVLKAFTGALVMVLLDILIEPVAIAFDFWAWHGVNIPLQNYIAWGVLAFAFLLWFHLKIGTIKNQIAPILFMIQVLFFGILNFTL